MINNGDDLNLTIESLAFGGAGVARYEGIVVFTHFVIPGEEVKVLITKVHSNYAEASLTEVLKPSPLRIKPKCPYFSQCGGCVYQHLPYYEQLKIKKDQVIELFNRIGGEGNIIIDDVCPSPKEFNYRTKIRLKYKKFKSGYKFGYFDFFQNHVLDIEKCDIASDLLNDFLTEVRKDNFSYFRKRRVKSYNLAFMEGNADSIITNLEPAKNIEYEVEGKKFHYGRDSFFQINRSIFAPLFESIYKCLENRDLEEKVLLDLYCGVGFFGIVLADYFRKVQFIELNRNSYEFLQKNIEENKLKEKSETFCAAADKVIDQLSESPDVVLMDPPRAGSTPYSIEQVATMNPEVIIYISCNPATQARDIKIFADYNYRTEYIKPFDFFPQTKHVETMAILSKKD